MPHIIVDYSPNMEERVDIAALCDGLRRAAIETGILPMAGIRVRAVRATHVSIADGDPQHGQGRIQHPQHWSFWTGPS